MTKIFQSISPWSIRQNPPKIFPLKTSPGFLTLLLKSQISIGSSSPYAYKIKKYKMTKWIFLYILFPSLWDIAIIEQWELIIKSKLELFWEYILAGVLHYWMIVILFFHLEFSIFLFWDLHNAIYHIFL